VKEYLPAALIELLASLDLATERQIRAARGRVRRLGAGPHYDSLWVDALVQARLLTPWQASEINCGQAASLKVGPFVLCEPLARLGYATVFRAREIGNRRFVRLSLAHNVTDVIDTERRFGRLVGQAEILRTGPLVPLVQHGRDDERLWACTEYFSGRSAQQWLIAHGRFTPLAVLEIARQMLAGLTVCEQYDTPHTDIGSCQLWFDTRWRVRLPELGLRGVLRPTEHEPGSPLSLTAYDYLAPERSLDQATCNSRSELYACGALWWHLLAGRPPLPGATVTEKLRAAQTVKLPDIRRLAPDTPAVLAEAVMACLAREPFERPESLATLAASLGSSTPKSQRLLARLLKPSPRYCAATRLHIGDRWRPHKPSTRLAATAGAVLGLAIIAWPAIWDRFGQGDKAPPYIETVAPPPIQRLQPNTVGQAIEKAQRQNAPSSSGPVIRTSGEEPLDRTLSDADAQVAPSQDTSRAIAHADGERRFVLVPSEGIEVVEDGATLENIDFVARQPLSPGRAMLIVRGSKTEIRGCSFQTSEAVPDSDLPTAIAQNEDVDPVENNADLSTSELEIRDTVFRRVKSAIRCKVAGGTIVRLDNVLHLGVGSGVEFDRFPAADELLAIGLSRVTLRGARTMIEIGCDQLPVWPGRLEINAEDCGFVLPAAAALVEYRGATRPGPLLKGLRWSGQGSVLSPRARLALWRMPDGRMLAAPDESLPIEGVVRAEVGFAGEADESPAASRIVRWQAPLRSPHPPGIDGNVLHLAKGD
jgi:eukaryotic-like serine/threonine-protein kinase